MRTDWRTRGTRVPGWTQWQLLMACVFPELDMQDEIDQVELGEQAWFYIEAQPRHDNEYLTTRENLVS